MNRLIPIGLVLVLSLLPACKDVPFYADGDSTLVLATSKTFLRTGNESGADEESCHAAVHQKQGCEQS